MARARQVQAVLRSADERTWVAQATDGSRAEAKHYLPGMALEVLTERLVEHWGGPVKVAYEYRLPPNLRDQVEELLALEDEMQRLSRRLPTQRIALADELQRRHIKQVDIAAILGISQGYLATLIKAGAEADGGEPAIRRKKPANKRASKDKRAKGART